MPQPQLYNQLKLYLPFINLTFKLTVYNMSVYYSSIAVKYNSCNIVEDSNELLKNTKIKTFTFITFICKKKNKEINESVLIFYE